MMMMKKEKEEEDDDDGDDDDAVMQEVLLQKGNRESFGKRYLWRLSWVYKRRNGVIIGSFCSLVIQTKTLGKYLTSPPTMLFQCNGDK